MTNSRQKKLPVPQKQVATNKKDTVNILTQKKQKIKRGLKAIFCIFSFTAGAGSLESWAFGDISFVQAAVQAVVMIGFAFKLFIDLANDYLMFNQ